MLNALAVESNREMKLLQLSIFTTNLLSFKKNGSHIALDPCRKQVYSPCNYPSIKLLFDTLMRLIIWNAQKLNVLQFDKHNLKFSIESFSFD